MVAIVTKCHKDGTYSYWIQDERKNRSILIPAGKSRGEAELILEQYLIRRDLEKTHGKDL